MTLTSLRIRLAFLVALSSITALGFSADAGPDANRWSLTDDGGITWAPERGEVHHDHIEMSGLRVSTVVSYDIDRTGHLSISRQVIWPMLRFNPNRTKDHLSLTFGEEAAPLLFLDKMFARSESVTRLTIKGTLRAEGTFGRNREIAFTRTVFPSTDKPVVFDRTELVNQSDRDIVVGVDSNDRRVETDPEQGVYGSYIVTSEVVGAGRRTLRPGESTSFTVVLSAWLAEESVVDYDFAAEEKARLKRIGSVLDEMQLITPDPVLNTAFSFAKIRATESIYATKGGLMHGPGGGAYYAAVWANDQAEYANPFFAMLADPIARESAINSYRHFAAYMNDAFEPIPSSIISEGAHKWNGAKDRGDMAMIAYGASRFALTLGDREAAEELWPLIAWCLEYCDRKLTPEGVVASDSDELENRFPSGKANLCTSSLYYDALLSAADLAGELGRPKKLGTDFRARAKTLRSAIESYFGAEVEGFDTYRYFDKSFPSYQARHAHYADEPDHLRAWICVPLTVGIYDRAAETIDALFSPRLWTADGLATEAGKETFWDRSTLYALRGVFAAGETQRALDYLTYYSNRRLLGDHVPYPVEAYPEGGQRHLSAESALYCRIFTEGIFGIRPTGLNSFSLTPRLPSDWPSMTLEKVHAFGGTFDLSVTREGNQLRVNFVPHGSPVVTRTMTPGDTIELSL